MLSLILTESIEINPHHADVYSARAAAYIKQNNLSKAINDYTKAIEINPS